MIIASCTDRRDIHTGRKEAEAATQIDLRSQRTFGRLYHYHYDQFSPVMNLPPPAPAIGAQIIGDLMPENDGRRKTDSSLKVSCFLSYQVNV
jgi:hypothetical protein